MDNKIFAWNTKCCKMNKIIRMLGTFPWPSAYIQNMFLECKEWAQDLSFKQKMVWFRFAAFAANSKTTRHPIFTIDPYGWKIEFYIFHIIHALHRLFSHKGICSNIEIWEKMIQSSVSRVNIYCYLKAKFGRISRYLNSPDPYKINFMWTTRSELVGLGF